MLQFNTKKFAKQMTAIYSDGGITLKRITELVAEYGINNELSATEYEALHKHVWDVCIHIQRRNLKGVKLC